MNRHRVLWLTILGLVLASLACNAFAGTPEPAVPPPPTFVGSMPTTTAPDVGAAPTVTLPGTTVALGTETPAGPQVQALVDVNVRAGPGVAYSTDGFLLKGETAVLIGKDPTFNWWKIACPPRSTGPHCWVSGRAQYTAAANADNVPIAEIPPTPTPEPGNVGPVVVYVAGGRITVLPLTITQSPPLAGEPQLVGARSDVQDVLISPDGRKIAYKAGAIPNNELRVINVDGSDDRLLVAAADFPVTVIETVDTFRDFVNDVQWTPDSRTLVFNTGRIGQEMPLSADLADLWTVSLDGDPVQLFAPGNGGGAFAISSTGQVILSQEETIRRVRLDGSGVETLLQFERVNTASEYTYYPQPQWTADGSRAFVAIPDREPFAPGATATLWQIPTVGTAVPLGALPGNILFNPVTWSPNGAQLAYARQLVGSANVEPQLMVGSANGQDVGVYNSAEQITFFAWSPDNTHFLYTAGQFYAVGRANAGPMTISIPLGQQARAARWLTADTFIVAVGSGSAWTLRSGNVAGETAQLTTFTGSGAAFAVWTR
ncbi:MAG: hypothetical protein IAE79_00165 [Anaerolinea sp.]|nr:hypothetical protein [Anaerolinea sp.]